MNDQPKTFFSRNRILFGMLLLASMVIGVINVLTYRTTRNVLTEVTETNMSTVLENSERGRQISSFFTDIHNFRYLFLGDREFLKVEGNSLIANLDSIVTMTKSRLLKSQISELSKSLSLLIDTCKEINTLYYSIQASDKEIHSLLNGLEDSIGKSLIQETLQDQDTSYLEQLLILIVGYKETLLEIDILVSELGASHIQKETIQTEELFSLIDDLTLRLHTITASVPEIAENGKRLISKMAKHRQYIELYLYHFKVLWQYLAALNTLEKRLNSEMVKADKKVSRVLGEMQSEVSQTIYFSNIILFTLTILVFIGQGIAIFYLFKKMDKEIAYRKKVDSKLRKSEARLKALSDASFEAIFLSQDGICQDQNLAARKMFGYSLQEAVGKPIINWIDDQDKEIVTGRILRSIEEPYQAIARRKDGSTFPSEIKARIIEIDGISMRIAALRDITDQKRAQHEKESALQLVAEAKKLALVGKIAGKLAHDFNNILTVILGLSEIVICDSKEKQTKEDVQLILEQALRGKNLTKNLVAFAKDQEVKQQFFNIDDKIDLVLSLMKKDLTAIHLVREKGAEIPHLLADSGMIEHALVNILQNSIHAVSKTEAPAIQLSSSSNDTHIQASIKDNGCGIPEEHLSSIFDPAFTLKGSMDQLGAYHSDIKGTGYGMANVKKYIEMHKGEISLQSIVNEGTTVTISLPIVKEDLSPKEQAVIQKEPTFFDKYILLVEDEIPISNIQYRILSTSPNNHKVDIAPNGQNAKDLLDRNNYDLVSLDYMLPGDINGMDVYHHIRQHNDKIPILFISGNIEFLESIILLKEEDPLVDHLSKPCQNVDYILHINRLFGKVARNESL